MHIVQIIPVGGAYTPKFYTKNDNLGRGIRAYALVEDEKGNRKVRAMVLRPDGDLMFAADADDFSRVV